MVIGRPIAKVLDIVCGAVAFVAVAVVAAYYICNYFGLFIGEDVLLTLSRVKDVALLTVLGLAGLAFALRRNLFVFLAFLVVAVVAAVFIFLTWA